MELHMIKSKLLSLGTGLAVSLLAVTNANANPFHAENLQAGYDNAGFDLIKTTSHDGSCGAAKCGADMKKNDGSCGAKKKAEDAKTDLEAKTEEIKSDADKKIKDGKCGADKKATEHQCGANQNPMNHGE
jgi:uncharacterized low-complexity protein